MSPGRASSLGQTPAKCASVRWVRAVLRGGDSLGAAETGGEAGLRVESQHGQEAGG